MKKQRHKDFIKNRIKALFGKEKPLEAKALDEFVEDIADHQQTLQERIKELNCLYEASSLMADKEIATDQFMQSLSNIIKQAWQFPEITCVKIKIDGNEYLTANYSDTPWKLTSPVTMDGKDMGLLQVCYLEEKSASDEGPFLKEERNLLETIAGNLSQSLQNMKSEELLKKSRQRLLDAQRIAKMGDFTWNVQTGEVQWSKAMYELLGYDEDEKINFEKVNVDIHHPDDLERVIDWLNRCIKSGETHHEHQGYRVVTKDGKVLEVQTHIRINYVDGKATELLGTVQDITQRKRDEKALWESREHFRVTLLSIGDAVIATDTNACITAMNPVAEKLTAWEFEAAKGKKIQEIFNIYHAKTGDVVGNPVEKVLKTGHIVGLANHTRLIAKNGKEYQIADSGAPIVDKNGDTIGVVLVFRDVSREYSINEALKSSEEKFKSVFESANVGKSITKPTGEINVNKAFCDMLGYSQSEIKNKKWQDITPTDEIESIEKLIETLLNGTRDSARFEKRYIHKNGSLIWTDVSVAIYRNANRKPLYFLTTVVDITERKLAEMSLQKEKEWSENIVKNAPNIIVGLGERSKIKLFNQFAEKLTGYRAEEVIGKEWIGVFIPEDMQEKIYRVWAEIVENKLIDHHFENEIITKSGEKRMIEWSNTILTEGDEFRMILSLGEDITDRKNAEEKLKQSHELMRYIIENTNSAIAVHNRDLQYIYVSQRYLNDFKISGLDVIGKHHYEVFPDLPEKWRKVHKRALRGEVLSADRDPYHRANGTTDWTRWECRPWYESRDTIGGIIVYTEVITEQIETEIKLREYNKKLEQAEENARLGSWEVDLQTGKTWWSKQMFKLLGFEQSDNAPGFDEYLEHIHPADKEKVSVALDNLKKGVITPSMEYRGNPDFTGQKYLLSRAKGVKDQTGKLIKIMGTVLDITDQKLIENEISKLT